MPFSSTELIGQTSCSWDDKTSSTTWTFPPRILEKDIKENLCVPTLLAAVLQFVLPLKSICSSWPSNLQQVSTYAFCSCDDILTQKRNCSAPNILSKCTDWPLTLSTKTSIEWNQYLSCCNLFVTSFRLEINVGGFSNYQNRRSDSDRYKRFFFTARVSQVNVINMKRLFEQQSKL